MSGADKLDGLCRLCATHDALKIEIYGAKGRERNLAEKMTACLPFEISEEDSLPKALCYKCIFHLETFFDFRKECIKAVSMLEDFLRQSGTKIVPCTRTELPAVKIEVEDPAVENETEWEWKDGGGLQSPEPFNPSDFLEACLEDSCSPRSCQDIAKNSVEEGSGTVERSPEKPPSSDVHKCHVCSRAFLSHSSLLLHSKFHGDGKRSIDCKGEVFPCYVCDKVFSSKSHLSLHRHHHSNRVYRCELCGKWLWSCKELWVHVSRAHRGHPLVTCDLCQRMFSSIANLQDHLRLKHKDLQEEKMESPCGGGIEEGALGNRRKASKPRKIEHPPSFSLNHLQDDVEIEMDGGDGGIEVEGDSVIEMERERALCCEVCVREFSDRGSLWLHMLYTHREEAGRACGLCLKIFSDHQTLVNHVNTCNPRTPDRRRYSCTVCGRQHDSRKKLVLHARIHRLADGEGRPVDPESVVALNSTFPSLSHSILEEPFQCVVCYKTFDTEARMIKHKASAHRENKTGNPYYFVCDLCGLTSSSRTDKWKHVSTDHAGDPTLTCPQPQCNKVFVSEGLKKEHCEIHHEAQGPLPSTCEVCGKLWNTRVEYWKHMMGVHPDLLPLVCGVCLKVFCELGELVDHVRERHQPLQGGEHCCDICGRPYSKLSKMSRHRKIHATVPVPEHLRALVENPVRSDRGQGSHFMDVSGPPYPCQQCGPDSEPVWQSLEELGAHRREAHREEGVGCDLCTKFYSSTSQLWKHVSRCHKGHPLVTCHICKRTSANGQVLAVHMAKHRSPNPDHPSDTPQQEEEHACTKCNKIFRKGSLMRKHAKHCKGPRAAPAVASLPPPVHGISTCAKCGKQFTSQNTLYKHVKSVHVLYPCEICPDSKHDSRTLLYQHILEQHSDHPSFKCDVEGCDKILRSNADMLRHRRTHSQMLGIYVCKFCAELLPSKVKMRKHMKLTHASDSKHLCFVCIKPAPTFQQLQEHVREAHAALARRPNTCSVCCRTCSSKSKLIDHIKNHSPTFFPCRICLTIFHSPETLKEHVDNHPTETTGDQEEVEEEEEEDHEIEEVELDESSIMDIIGASTGKSSVVGSLHDSESVDSPGADTKTTDTTTTTTTTTSTKRNTDSSEPDPPPSKKMKPSFTCVPCQQTFQSRSSLLAHEEEEHEETTCKKCGLVSSDQHQHQLHTDACLHHDSTVNASDSVLQESAGSPSSPEDFESTNGEVFSERAGRNKNPRKVYMDDSEPSACQICGKMWPAKKHLWQHLIRFHKKEARTACGVCLSCFPDYLALSAHLLSEHPANYDGDGTNLTCRVCGKYHNARAKLHSHVSIHPGQEQRASAPTHSCLLCQRTFPLFNQLSEHFFNIHRKPAEQLNRAAAKKNPIPPPTPARTNKSSDTKLPFYQCDVCSLVFASEIGLTNHKWSHKNSDNFKCGQCGEVFGSVVGLKEHKRVKHPGTEFVCAQCKRAFPTYPALAEHNKVCSTGERSPPESEEDKSPTSDSSDSDSSDDSSDSDTSDSEDSDDSSDKTAPPADYAKCPLSESSSSDEEPAPLTLAEGDLVQIVEVDADAPNSQE